MHSIIVKQTKNFAVQQIHGNSIEQHLVRQFDIWHARSLLVCALDRINVYLNSSNLSFSLASSDIAFGVRAA